MAPGSADRAAGASTTVNVGITAGAFVGSMLLPFGVRGTALAAACLAALAVVLGEPLAAGGREPAAAALQPATALAVPAAGGGAEPSDQVGHLLEPGDDQVPPAPAGTS